jgi:RNA polymerase sigma factor for flagellar operon FliA
MRGLLGSGGAPGLSAHQFVAGAEAGEGECAAAYDERMLSLQGASSALIARNESWVRKQASALVRHLPSNVEKADLIQVGLIAVAQAALGFKWEGDADSEAAKEAFVRYARMRVKGAMLDELRQMDHLGRAQRREIKVIQIARERWRAHHGADPGLAELSGVCGIGVDEIARLDQAALMAQTESLCEEPDPDGNPHAHAQHPATPRDEVEARVDTAIVMRRLEKFFATLPERERQVIDAYLGVGMSPVELAGSLRLSPSRVSQIYKSVCHRIARHFGHADQRAHGRWDSTAATPLDELVALREAELARSADAAAPWGALMEDALTMPEERFDADNPDSAAARLVIDSSTRWG